MRVFFTTVRRTVRGRAFDVERAAFRAGRDLVVLVRVARFVVTLRAVRPDLVDVVRFVELRRLVDLLAVDRPRERLDERPPLDRPALERPPRRRAAIISLSP